MPFVADLKDALWPWVKRARMERDRLLGGNCVVLLYHRVFHTLNDPQLLCVSPANFNAQMALVKERFRVLSVEEFEYYLLGRRRFPKNSVFITFDDGYADNHYEARPILESHGLQALFYIASGYIGSGREYWWDELERLLLLPIELPQEVNVSFGKSALEWKVAPSPEVRRTRYEQLLVQLRAMDPEQRDRSLAQLRHAIEGAAAARAAYLPMDHGELNAFATSSAVVLGAHTVGHPSLGMIEEESQVAEIVGSKRDLEEWTGRPITRFAYPFGTPADHSAATQRIVRQAGFAHAAANHPGIVHARSPHFAFHRVLIRDWDQQTFLKAIAPFLW